MLSEEMKKKLASLPVEEPDEIDRQMMAEAEAETMARLMTGKMSRQK